MLGTDSKLHMGALYSMATDVLSPVAGHIYLNDFDCYQDITILDNVEVRGIGELRYYCKEKSDVENIAERLGSELARLFLGGDAAEVVLALNEGQEAVYTASKKIFAYRSAGKCLFQNQGIIKYSKADNAVLEFEGMKKAVAVRAFLGDPDLHAENIGINLETGHATSIDFGEALLFCTSSDKFSANHTKNSRRFPGNKFLGDIYTPADALRTLHAHEKFRINRSILISEDFAEQVDWVVDKYNNDLSNFNSCIKDTVESICDTYKEAKGEEFDLALIKFPNIGKDVTLANLGEKLVSEFSKRAEQMTELSFSIRIQLALRQGKTLQDVEGMLETHGYEKDKKFTFLPNSPFASAIKPPMTVSEYYHMRERELSPSCCAIL